MNEKIEALAVRRLQWLNALKAGEVDSIVYFLTDDARVFLPDRTFIKNAGSIGEWLKVMFGRFDCTWLLSQVSRLTGETHAFEKGIFNISAVPKSGGLMINQERDYIILWRLPEQTKWRVIGVSISSEFTTGH